jgi:hypothetical protein
MQPLGAVPTAVSLRAADRLAGHPAARAADADGAGRPAVQVHAEKVGHREHEPGLHRNGGFSPVKNWKGSHRDFGIKNSQIGESGPVSSPTRPANTIVTPVPWGAAASAPSTGRYQAYQQNPQAGVRIGAGPGGPVPQRGPGQPVSPQRGPEPGRHGYHIRRGYGGLRHRVFRKGTADHGGYRRYWSFPGATAMPSCPWWRRWSGARESATCWPTV